MQKLRRLTVGQQILFTFGTLCLILLLIGGLSFFSLRSIERGNQRQQSLALNKLALIDDAAQDVGQIQAIVLREVLVSGAANLKNLGQTVVALERVNAKELAEYRKFADTEKEKQFYQRVMEARKIYWQQTQLVLSLGRAGQGVQAIELIDTKQAPAYDEYLKTINVLTQYVEIDVDKTANATAQLIAQTRIIGEFLIGLAISIALGAGFAVANVVHRLKEANVSLQTHIKEREQVENELVWRTAFFEAQINSSLDGVLVVDEHGKQILQSQRFTDLLKIPRHIAENKDDEQQVRWVTERAKNPKQFAEKIAQLYAHPDAIGRDEVEFKDGMTLDRYSSPVIGKDGRHYGRIWTFRDVTERKQVERHISGFAKLGQRLSSAASTREAFGIVREVSMELFSWDAFWVKLYSPESDLIHSGIAVDTVDGMQVASEQWEPKSPTDLYRRIIETGGELILRDKPLATLPGTVPYGNASRPSAALIFVPIRSRSRTIGILSVQSYTPNAYSEPDLNRLQIMADQCGGAFERIWADEDRAKFESQFRLVWNASADGMRLVDREGVMQIVNDAYCRMIGKAREELEGQPISIIYVDEFAAEALRIYKTIREATAIQSHMEKLVPLWDGRKIWFEVTNSVLQVPGQTDLVLSIFRDVTRRKKEEETLRLLSSAVEQSKESIVITNAELDLPGPNIIFVNPAFTKMTGYTQEEAIGKTPRILQGQRTDKAVLKRLRQTLDRGEAFEGETLNYRRDGDEFNLEWQIAPIREDSGKITHFVGIQRDITERKRLEAQLFQSQKMETVGKLAGGVAHEFNSILTAIIGQSELLSNDLPKGSPLAENVSEITKAATRAAALTAQLLAYGRKQFLKPEVLNVNQVIGKGEGMLRQIMGSDVDMKIVFGEDLQSVMADAGQIEQVITNITMNARTAMPNGGKLTLETANISFDESSLGGSPDLKPGEYVMLAITDTGIGMTADVQARMFEPFFSTKGVGQGTGLGLSTCYGIVKQSGGHIRVYSEPGRGTTFKIYLPQIGQQSRVSRPRPTIPDLPRGTEKVLLVEDDPGLREMAATLLRRLGYTVFVASNGVEAINMGKNGNIGRIDLLFTDVVMPMMNGKELSEYMLALDPLIKVLFTSAYTESAIIHQGVLNKGMMLLQKPFTPSALAHKLREVFSQ